MGDEGGCGEALVKGLGEGRSKCLNKGKGGAAESRAGALV